MTDGPQALDQLRTKRYGLVISDLDMEPMDGIQLLREIRPTTRCTTRRSS